MARDLVALLREWWRDERHARQHSACGPHDPAAVEIDPYLVQCPHGRLWRAFLDPVNGSVWWQSWN